MEAIKDSELNINAMLSRIRFLERENAKLLTENEFLKAKCEHQQTKADNVNSPAHYTDSKFECIDEMVLLFGVEQVKAFCRCNAWKYRHRANLKNGAEDIAKADKYLEFLDNLIASGNPYGITIGGDD